MPLITAYTPDYFSIDDILATQDRTPCKFLQHVPKLGKLNPSNEDTDLQIGTELELPLWLTLETTTGRHPIISAQLPKVYREAYREMLKADPTAVDLHKFNLYFYEIGQHIKHWDRRGDVADILIYTFKLRFRQLMDLADNTLSDPNVQQKLDMLERTLFKDAHNARIKLNNWLINSGVTLKAADMVVNHKKRKRVEDDDFI